MEVRSTFDSDVLVGDAPITVRCSSFGRNADGLTTDRETQLREVPIRGVQEESRKDG
jgi:hypothetical protein